MAKEEKQSPDYAALFGRPGAGGYFAVTVSPERFQEIWGITIEEFAQKQAEAPIDPVYLRSHPGRAY